MDEKHLREETETASPANGYETTDAQSKPIYIFLGGLTALIILSFLAMAIMFAYLEDWQVSEDRAPSPLSDPNQLPPAPRLDTTPRGQLDEVLSKTRGRLEGYAWIDEDMGVARIPIERAIELTLSQGLPTRAAPGQPEREQ